MKKIVYYQVVELLLEFPLRHYAIRTSLFMCTKGQRGANPIPRTVVVHTQVRQCTEKSLIRLRNRLVRCCSVQDRPDNSGRPIFMIFIGRSEQWIDIVFRFETSATVLVSLCTARGYAIRTCVLYARTHARTQIQPVSLPLSLSLCARGHK